MRNLNIKYKIALSSIFLIIIFGIIISGVTQYKVFISGIENYKITGLSTIQNIEPHIADHLYLNEIVDLQRIINRIKKSNLDIIYVFVLNPEKQVVVHTFDKGFPTDLLKINTKAQQNIELLDVGKESVYDFSYPIENGKLGVLRIGMSRIRLMNSLKNNIKTSIFLLLGFIILGIIVSLYVSNHITNPLKKLVESVNKISKGNFKQTIKIKSKDEIGLLSMSFNKMAYNLETLTNKLNKQIELLNFKNNEYAALNEELTASGEELQLANNKLVEMSKTLKESDDKQRTILNTFIDGLYINSSDYIIEYMNYPMIKMLGGDKTGQKCFKALYKRNTICEWCIFNKLEKENTIFYELKNPITNKYYRVKNLLLNNGSKVTAFNDISELKQKEFKLKAHNVDLIKAKEKAEMADKLKSAFLANMSHEIRTPMNGIIGFIELLKNSNPDKKKRNYFMNIIQKSGTQLLSIINDIVDISKIEAGQINIHNVDIDINNVLSELYETFKQSAVEKGLKLTLNIETTNIYSHIKSDKVRLKQILSNLINNALKFTHKGSIEFGYRLVEQHGHLPQQVEFYVKDTGIGIKPDDREIIFERFRQVELTSTREYGGTGLGLAITKALVEKLDGNIHVDSKFGEGSIFYVTLPYIPVKEVKSHTEFVSNTFKPLNNWSEKTILIAEDETSNFIYLEELLSNTKANLIRVFTGKEACEVSRSENIDLILMDIKMPVMDGLEAAQKIKSLNPKIPIIAQTAYALEGDKEKAMKAGCVDFITKPITANLLLEKINKFIN